MCFYAARADHFEFLKTAGAHQLQAVADSSAA
jgi:hypothetical protein